MQDLDARMRAAAFERVRRIQSSFGYLTAQDLKNGFEYGSEHIFLSSQAQGIFKPRQMEHLLSVKTVIPKPGRKKRYEDQHNVFGKLFTKDGRLTYAFKGDKPKAVENQWLRNAWLNRTPVIYFCGIAPAKYYALLPVFITAWDPGALSVRMAVGPGEALADPVSVSVERQYAMQDVKQRVHQAKFRVAILDAYGQRCALSGLAEPTLLDAASIIPHSEATMGQPEVPNGLALSKLHHAAFDSHLLGIDPDYLVHISPQLMANRDGPALESLKTLNGRRIILPRRHGDAPDRDRLARRYELFRRAV